MKIHLVGGNLNNKHGMEYYTMKALEAEGILGPISSYRTTPPKAVSMQMQYGDYDVLLVLKGEMVDPAVVNALPKLKFLWYQDDVFATKHGAREINDLAWAYDITYTFDHEALATIKNLGARVVKWLPLAADPDVHKPMDLPKEYDISFIGAMYQNRQHLYLKLKQKFDNVLFATDYDKYMEIVAKTKINLNLAIGETGYTMRVFEILSMGGFLLSNDNAGWKLFEDGKHLVYFNDGNILELIEYWLSHDKERDKVSQYGQLEVLDKHTYRHRVRQIIEDAQIWINRNET